MEGPEKPRLDVGSVARFAALRSLWLRQANLFTLLVLPKMPAGLRRGPRPTCRRLHQCAGSPVSPGEWSSALRDCNVPLTE